MKIRRSKDRKAGQWEGNIWRWHRGLQPFPSPLQPPSLCHVEPMLHYPPPARPHRQGTMGRRFLSHAEAPPHPIWTALWQQHACPQLDHSQGGKRAAEVQAVHADLPAPCNPEAPVANGRPHLAAWLRASRCAGGDCRSITSPKPSCPLSNHQQALQSAAAPHVPWAAPGSSPFAACAASASGCWVNVFSGS